MAAEKHVPFQSQMVTVYRSGSGHPFPPGSKLTVPESHLAPLQAVDTAAFAAARKRAAAAKAAADLAKAEGQVAKADPAAAAALAAAQAEKAAVGGED